MSGKLCDVVDLNESDGFHVTFSLGVFQLFFSFSLLMQMCTESPDCVLQIRIRSRIVRQVTLVIHPSTRFGWHLRGWGHSRGHEINVKSTFQIGLFVLVLSLHVNVYYV